MFATRGTPFMPFFFAFARSPSGTIFIEDEFGGCRLSFGIGK